ncbi:tRNA (N(6)-L-threonylcarbamoyladenosine(37)-C(2))-methylthiotransferase MtaB [Eubacteriales bacterium OttesenSCG-928-K08]|nr:tRNA (N(6)-L-threonylcarbamoyladenosine(37)-C(2))-methylthiotransferase MtaB [Eubacteriales bacterium OttesenSCG-928-K08]
MAFYTLGCKVNQQETNSMRLLFERAGYKTVPFEEKADVYVVNTCTVTHVSDKKSRQHISRAHANNPEAIIAVVGCYAQNKPEEVGQMPGVSLVIGTQHREQIVELVEQAMSQNVVEDIQKAKTFEALPVALNVERTRVQVKIQDGCDRYCAYCIIPYVRGPVRSCPLSDVQKTLAHLSEQNVGELVLTGIHLMSYGKDLPGNQTLAGVIKAAAGLPGIGRVRLGSLEPALVDDSFVETLKEIPSNKLCEQFHLSLQSGSACVLKRMGRRYTTVQYKEAVERLRGAFPNCAITTDVIAGFPGETLEEHNECKAFLKEIGFARIHVFPYSRREGTCAAEMKGQLSKQIKQLRAKELILLGADMEAQFLRAQIGTNHLLLVEERGEGMCEGYTGNYCRVRAQYKGENVELLPVRIVGVEGETLIGECIGQNKI